MAGQSERFGAPLSEEASRKIQDLERRLGNVYIIAYDHPVVPARLTADQVKELQRAESELGVFLVAYERGAQKAA